MDLTEIALYKVLEGIRKDLKLKTRDLIDLLPLNMKQYSDLKFGKGNLSVNQKKEIAMFINIYDCIFSLFVHKKDSINWYSSKIDKFNMTPFELMKNKRIIELNDHTNYLVWGPNGF